MGSLSSLACSGRPSGVRQLSSIEHTPSSSSLHAASDVVRLVSLTTYLWFLHTPSDVVRLISLMTYLWILHALSDVVKLISLMTHLWFLRTPSDVVKTGLSDDPFVVPPHSL